MKRCFSLLLIFVLILSTSSINVFASSKIEAKNEENKYLSGSELTNLWLEGRENFELIESTNDQYFISRFSVGDTFYQIEEVISDDLKSVESRFYLLKESKKEYIGQQTTHIEKVGEHLNITVMEEGEVIDSQFYNILNENFDTEKISNSEFIYNSGKTFSANAEIERKWFSQGIYNGSNNIYRYTAAAIVAALATAAGGATAAGLAAIASLAISDNYPAIYWSKETWVLMERSSSWASYPDWVFAGQYLYQTYYYSNKERTNQIGYTTHLDG